MLNQTLLELQTPSYTYQRNHHAILDRNPSIVREFRPPPLEQIATQQ